MESTLYWERKLNYKKRVQWVFYSFTRTIKNAKTRVYVDVS